MGVDCLSDSPVNPAGCRRWSAAAPSRTGNCWTLHCLSGLKSESGSVCCSNRPQVSEETWRRGQFLNCVRSQTNLRPGRVKLASLFYLRRKVKSCNVNRSLRVTLCAVNINLKQKIYERYSAGSTEAGNCVRPCSETAWCKMWSWSQVNQSQKSMFSLA